MGRVFIRIWQTGRSILALVGLATVAFACWLLLAPPLGVDRWLDVASGPIAADAIVCIGAGTGRQNLPLPDGWASIYTSVQLHADGYAPVVVFTGRGPAEASEAEIYARAAGWLGLPDGVALLDPLSASTAEHPQNLLRSSGGRITRQSRLLLVVSRLRSRRVLMTFRKQGFSNVRVITSYEARRATGRINTSEHLVSTLPSYTPSSKSYAVASGLSQRWNDTAAIAYELTALAWYWWKGDI